MQASDQINELAAALAKAQSEIGAARKSSENPFFHSKYADLAEVWETVRGPLSKNGLSVVQFPSVRPEKSDAAAPPVGPSEMRVVVTTMLLHSSGQFMADELALRCAKDDPQSVGSAITYARRYALAAAVGVAQEDDDGNSATIPVSAQSGKQAEMHNNASTQRKSRKPSNVPFKDQCKDLADELGIPLAARKAMIEEHAGDFLAVLRALEAARDQKAQREGSNGAPEEI